MEIIKVNPIERYIISDETKKLTNKQKRGLADKMFKEKYQGKTLTYEKMKEEMFVKINKKTRHNFVAHMKREKIKDHRKKIEIAADGQYLEFIGNPSFISSKNETKPDQSKGHKGNTKYYYFIKEVMIDDEKYRVLINVVEREKNKYYIHSVEMIK